MTNQYYILHDLANNTEIRISSYEVYIDYFKNVLRPDGYGTRYLYSEITRANQYYHYRIVEEKPCYTGFGRNEKAIVR